MIGTCRLGPSGEALIAYWTPLKIFKISFGALNPHLDRRIMT